MSIKLDHWDPTKNYKAGDRIIFYDKIFVALKDNKEILPIPVIGKKEDFDSNYESVSDVARNYYDDVDNHLNTQEVRAWLLI